MDMNSYKLSFDQIDIIQTRIKNNKKIQCNIKKEIGVLQSLLDQAKLEEHFLYLKIIGPVIIPADSKVLKYKHLTECIVMDKIEINLYHSQKLSPFINRLDR